jgi:hypothetical protein
MNTWHQTSNAKAAAAGAAMLPSVMLKYELYVMVVPSDEAKPVLCPHQQDSPALKC